MKKKILLTLGALYVLIGIVVLFALAQNVTAFSILENFGKGTGTSLGIIFVVCGVSVVILAIVKAKLHLTDYSATKSSSLKSA